MKLRTLDSLTDAEKALYERWKYNCSHPLEGEELAFFKTHFSRVFCEDIVRLLLEEDCKVIRRQSIYDEQTHYELTFRAKSYGPFLCAFWRDDDIFGEALCSVWISRYLHFKNKGYYHQLHPDTKGLESNSKSLITLLETIFFNIFLGPLSVKETLFRNFVLSIYKKRWYNPPQYQDTNFLILLTMLDYTNFSYQGPYVFPIRDEY